jgi:hypothetical protein
MRKLILILLFAVVSPLALVGFVACWAFCGVMTGWEAFMNLRDSVT